MNIKILEILVDRNNEKGPEIFHEILGVLHRAVGNSPSQEHFSFEITKIGSRIRFFLVCPKKYSDFLANQIYAHYTNVEIIPVSDYLSGIPEDKITV